MTGNVAARLEKYQEAHDYFTRALEIQKEIPDVEDRVSEIEEKIEQIESKLTGKEPSPKKVKDKSDSFMVDVLIAGALVSVVVGLSTFVILRMRNQ